MGNPIYCLDTMLELIREILEEGTNVMPRSAIEELLEGCKLSDNN